MPPSKEPAKVVPLRPPGKCAVCGKPTVREFYPFCSKRCTNIDLNRWLSGSYAIPGATVDDERDSEKEKEAGDGEE